ncbi:MAG: hypothetical protein JYX80_13540 [Candidatus Scalindua sediminis]|nr:hypothetical protein [Candidatus Scalindua sediminis]
MSKRTVPDLKELFKQASEIAQQVPESMQQAAFNRAIDLLTGGVQSDRGSLSPPPKREKNKKKPPIIKTDVENSPADDLLSAIDSTQHPGVLSASKVLDRSLMVLQIALTDHEVDGLTPSVIARILTDKFRINTTKYAVSMTLGKATTLVNRIPDGQGFLYKIMAPGEEYLAHLGEKVSSPTASPQRKRVRKKRTADNNDNTAKKKAKTKQKKGTPKKAKTTSTGQKAVIVSLIESGFFDKGKTGPNVQAHLKTKRGLNFLTNQLRVVLLRLVREEKLERDKNAEGQYEYTKSKA